MIKLIKKILPTVVKELIRSGIKEAQLLPRYISIFSRNNIPDNAQIFYTKGWHTFFGYYDVSPIHHDKNIILATRTNMKLASPHDNNASLEIGYYDLENNNTEFQKIDETSCWNWQQGCRLQWLDDKKIIYNIFEDNQFKSVIYDLNETEKIQTINYPIYSINNDKKQAISLDFSRLHHFRRGYGYHNTLTSQPLKIPENDGIVKIDLNTGEKNILIDYQTIINHSPRPEFKTAHHYLNHLSYNPSDKKFLFFHLWTDDTGQRDGRLMVANIDGSEIETYAPNIRASHYCWLSENKILLTGLKNKANFGYYIINITDGTVIDYAKNILTGDGHPSMLYGQKIITDTYPDNFGYQELIKYNDINQSKEILAKFFIPIQYRKELRCDLHPRLNHDKSLVCTDIIYKNKRAMCVLPIEK